MGVACEGGIGELGNDESDEPRRDGLEVGGALIAQDVEGGEHTLPGGL